MKVCASGGTGRVSTVVALTRRQKNLAVKLSVALKNPLRLDFLEQLEGEGKLTPVAFSRSSGLPLSNVSFHVKTLREAGIVAEAETFQVRGSLAHSYELTPLGQMVLKLVEQI